MAKNQTSGCGCGGLVVLLAAAMVGLAVLGLLGGGGDYSTPSKEAEESEAEPEPARQGNHVSIGEEGVLCGVTVAGSTKEHLHRAVDLCLANDVQGMKLMMLRGEMALLQPGTRCLVIDSGGFITQWKEVRVLDGPLAGDSWFIKSHLIGPG